MEVGRKRLRTEIDDQSRQQKYLVTSRIVEKNDNILMKKIYGKQNSYLISSDDLIMLFYI